MLCEYWPLLFLYVAVCFQQVCAGRPSQPVREPDIALEGGPAQVYRQSFCFLSIPPEARAGMKEPLPAGLSAQSHSGGDGAKVRGGGGVTAVRQREADLEGSCS